jgi:hypothetical protein
MPLLTRASSEDMHPACQQILSEAMAGVQSLFAKREKIDEYGKQFPKLQRMLLSKLELRIVLGAIYRRKISTILNCEDIYRDCCDELSRDQFEDALHDLVNAKIVTQTGRNRETLFVSNLYLAHIFGVCANKYLDYGLDPKLYGPLGQLSLPLNPMSS